MKKRILCLCLTALASSLWAQSPGFLEFDLSDSYVLEPQTFDYRINVIRDTEDDEYDLDQQSFNARRKEMLIRLKENEARLRQFLDNQKIVYTEEHQDIYASLLKNENSLVFFRVELQNRAALLKLIATLKELPYINGMVENKIYPNGTPEEFALFTRLQAKARQKAEKMAASMGCSIGKILEVEQITLHREGFYTVVNQGMYEQVPYNQAKVDPLNLVVTLDYRFRFELLCK